MASKRIVLHFPRRLVNEPIVSGLVKRFGLDFNILKASITRREEGLLVLEIVGEQQACDDGMAYLEEMGVSAQPLSRDIVRNDAACTHCGACVPSCPTSALTVQRPSMEVLFDSEKCVACELCISACPSRAMELNL
jgi:ferredoxin